MKKQLWLVPMLASSAIAAGCGSRGQEQGWQTCVDRQSTVVDERRCQDERTAPHGVGYVPFYRWYYYPYGGSRYPLGYGAPRGGYYSAEPYAGVATGSMGVPHSGAVAPVVRGGFGATAHGFGVGE